MVRRTTSAVAERLRERRDLRHAAVTASAVAREAGRTRRVVWQGVRDEILRLGPVLILCCLGVCVIYSVCVPMEGVPERLYWRRQILFILVGLAAYAVIGRLHLPVCRATVLKLTYAVVCVGLLVLVLVMGRSTGNGLRWINLFGLVTIQPAEFAKVALLWVVAEVVHGPRNASRAASLRRQFLAAGAVVAPAVLIFLERSMGNTLVLVLSVAAILVTRWLSWQALAALGLAALATAFLGVAGIGRLRQPGTGLNLEKTVQHYGPGVVEAAPWGLTQTEIDSIIAPAGADGLLSHCPARFSCYLSRHGGWNAIQALRCIRIGGYGGQGYRRGKVTSLGYLPRTVQHTDFAYCVLSEAWGAVGGVAVLALIGTVIAVVLRSGCRSRHPAAWSFAVGFSVLLFVQTAVHVGMALRLLPIIGLPFPFVSYGGSALLAFFAGLGLLARYDLWSPGTAGEAGSAGRVPRAAGVVYAQPELMSLPEEGRTP